MKRNHENINSSIIKLIALTKCNVSLKNDIKPQAYDNKKYFNAVYKPKRQCHVKYKMLLESTD